MAVPSTRMTQAKLEVCEARQAFPEESTRVWSSTLAVRIFCGGGWLDVMLEVSGKP